MRGAGQRQRRASSLPQGRGRADRKNDKGAPALREASMGRKSTTTGGRARMLFAPKALAALLLAGSGAVGGRGQDERRRRLPHPRAQQ